MAISGLVVGSFLNVVIYRLPVMMDREWKAQCEFLLGTSHTPREVKEENFNLITPGSCCPRCKTKINALNNIPVFSYLLLRGKCSNCGQAIALRYPLVELLSGILTAYIAWHFGLHIKTLMVALFSWALICLSFIDLDHQILPDDITLPFLWIGILCNMFGLFTDIHSSLLGAMFGYGILWIIFISYKLVTGKEGMGHGDFKLLAMLGAWLGWQMLPIIILVSSFMGAVSGILQIQFSNHAKDTPIPFGPYLAIAGWITMIWGDGIMMLYLEII